MSAALFWAAANVEAWAPYGIAVLACFFLACLLGFAIGWEETS